LVNVIYMLLTSQGSSSIREALVAHGAFWFLVGVVVSSIGGLIWDVQRRLTQ
jgi:hypothetical protein